MPSPLLSRARAALSPANLFRAALSRAALSGTGPRSRASLLPALTLPALALTAGLLAPMPFHPAHAADVGLADLPKEARSTHALILKGGPYPYPKDGTTFGNHENNLPKHKRGYYREFTVPTPGAKNRGARRIVCGAEARDWSKNAPAACWYTGDHYQSFQKIKG